MLSVVALHFVFTGDEFMANLFPEAGDEGNLMSLIPHLPQHTCNGRFNCCSGLHVAFPSLPLGAISGNLNTSVQKLGRSGNMV